MNDLTPDPELETMETLTAECVRPLKKFKGLDMRNHSMASETYLAQALKSLGSDVSARIYASVYIYVHCAPFEEMCNAIWNGKDLPSRIFKFCERFEPADFDVALELIKENQKAEAESQVEVAPDPTKPTKAPPGKG